MPKGVYKRKRKIYPIQVWVKLYNEGLSFMKIASMYNVSKKTVSDNIEDKVNVRDRATTNTLESFFDRINKNSSNGCWEWTGCLNNKGYGIFTIENKHWFAHRLSYTVHKGEVGYLQVCHKCDNPKCVNPDHLFLGTSSDNMIDRNKKKRSPLIKLDTEQVLMIREMSENGKKVSEIASKFNIGLSTVRSIIYRKNWRYI